MKNSISNQKPYQSPAHKGEDQLHRNPAIKAYLDSIIADEDYAYAIEKFGEKAVRDMALRMLRAH